MRTKLLRETFYLQNGVLSALPYLVMWFVSLSLGYIADKMLAKKIMSLTNLRKTLGTIGKYILTFTSKKIENTARVNY